MACGWLSIMATTTQTSAGSRPPPPPPPPTGGPEPGAGDVILWQDNFNKATQAELVAGYDKRGVQQLITHGYSGKAIRFPYTANASDNLIEESFPPTNRILLPYWY